MNRKTFILKTKKDIKQWLDEMNINPYTINDDYTIDVNGDVSISYKNIYEIPIQFGNINGYFACNNNNLISLSGHPKKCRNFYCYNNPKLTYEYLSKFDFSFVKGELTTDYDGIDEKWNEK